MMRGNKENDEGATYSAARVRVFLPHYLVVSEYAEYKILPFQRSVVIHKHRSLDIELLCNSLTVKLFHFVFLSLSGHSSFRVANNNW